MKNIFNASADFPSPKIRNNAVCTEIIAAVHDGYKCTEGIFFVIAFRKFIDRFHMAHFIFHVFFNGRNNLMEFFLSKSTHNIINNRPLLFKVMQKAFCHTAHDNNSQRFWSILCNIIGGNFHIASLCILCKDTNFLKPCKKSKASKDSFFRTSAN